MLSKCHIYDVVATAWPSGANEKITKYAIDGANAYYSATEGRLILEVAIAVAGNGGRLYQIGYQVMCKAHSP